MKRHACACGAEVFFGNTQCLTCGRALGFDPASMRLYALDADGEVLRPATTDTPSAQGFARCRNGLDHGVCDWLVPYGASDPYCRACRLNKTIPNLNVPENLDRWRQLEEAKRRLIYTLLELKLPLDRESGADLMPLSFEFLQDQRTDPTTDEKIVLTGYFQGVITINAGEADRLFLERQRLQAGQSYRTLLGHFRHESGHYYFERLIADRERHDEFRTLFGDERVSYDRALNNFYGGENTWFEDSMTEERYVSKYASMHPLEDWAETWAHLLHTVDTLETAAERGFAPSFGPFLGEHEDDTAWQSAWMALTAGVNALNRSMGVADVYPFVLSPIVLDKLQFIRRAVLRAARPI